MVSEKPDTTTVMIATLKRMELYITAKHITEQKQVISEQENTHKDQIQKKDNEDKEIQTQMIYVITALIYFINELINNTTANKKTILEFIEDKNTTFLVKDALEKAGCRVEPKTIEAVLKQKEETKKEVENIIEQYKKEVNEVIESMENIINDFKNKEINEKTGEDLINQLSKALDKFDFLNELKVQLLKEEIDNNDTFKQTFKVNVQVNITDDNTKVVTQEAPKEEDISFAGIIAAVMATKMKNREKAKTKTADELESMKRFPTNATNPMDHKPKTIEKNEPTPKRNKSNLNQLATTIEEKKNDSKKSVEENEEKETQQKPGDTDPSKTHGHTGGVGGV